MKMTIKELVRLCVSYEQEIVICNGSLRRKDIVYSGTIENIPSDLLNCTMRGWKVSQADILNQHSYCLFVQVDSREFGKTNESRNRKKSSNRHLRRMSESPVYSVTDSSYYDEIAKEVAQYMGYSEDEAYDELQSDPQSIIDYLEDEEDYYNNRSLIRKIEKYFM